MQDPQITHLLNQIQAQLLAVQSLHLGPEVQQATNICLANIQQAKQ